MPTKSSLLIIAARLPPPMPYRLARTRFLAFARFDPLQ